jgi:long-chain acyl-CoA synthetase
MNSQTPYFLAPKAAPWAAEVDVNAYTSVVDIFHQAVEQFADRPAFANFGQMVSFAEVERKSRDVAAYLQAELGLVKGDRVAVMLPNITAFPVVMFGILRAGLVQVNVNPMYTARELKHQLNDADCQTIIVFSGVSDTLADVVDETPVTNVIIANLGDATNGRMLSPPMAMRFAHNKTVADMITIGETLAFTEPNMTADDLIYLQYTGGTTGLSKGAALSHGNMVANIMMYEAVSSQVTEAGKEIIITALPLYHIFALMLNCISYFKFGGLNVLITNPRDMPGFVAEMSKWKFTAISGVNTLYNGLLNTPGFSELDFDNLKVAWGGGAAIQRVVSDKWLQHTGQHIKEGYGLSETSPVLTLNPISDKRFTETVGYPMPNTELSLRDDDGNVVGEGESGEVWARGPQVMQGYWRNEEATANVMSDDGFFKTGDVAFMNDDGYYKIIDRKKDMAIVSGFNVYPTEVENIIAELPDIVEAAVIGVPDAKTGEAIKAFCVRTGTMLNSSDVLNYCRENLARYKVPKHVEFVDELPKSTVGKILRRELRKL